MATVANKKFRWAVVLGKIVGNIAAFAVLFVLLGGGYLFGFAAGIRQFDKKIEACAKEHNVYRCEMVAVPVK